METSRKCEKRAMVGLNQKSAVVDFSTLGPAIPKLNGPNILICKILILIHRFSSKNAVLNYR